MTVFAVARALLLGVEIILALPVLYLLAIAAGAIIGTIRHGHFGRREPESTRGAAPRFAIVVPAHNEEMLIGKALQSLAALDYPTDRFTINVIADNCTDHTANIARAAGAVVYERANDDKRGKGYALAWAFDLLMHDETRYDAYVVLDADAVVDSQFLKELAGGIVRGAVALQSHNAVLNAAESETSALRWLALSLMNYIRPLGRNILGGSSTLTGNGMCLTHELLARHPWQAFGLSEDYQYYLSIIASGEKALFVPRANVRSVMPTTARQLTTQDIRWETISPDAQSWQRHIAWLLLRDGVRHFSWVRLDALAELLTPPLSVLASGCAVALVGALLLAAPLQLVLAGALSIALFAYVASAFILLRPPLGVYRAVAYAPFYIARKLWIYFVLRRQRKNSSTWVRTSRTA